MKRASYSLFLLLVVTGLFSSILLSAQQYHDAAAFGLKGHVKECKVVSGDFDPHTFVSLSFSKNGELERWEEDKGLLFTSFECERKNGYLSKLSKSHTGIYDMSISDTHCFFYDANKQLAVSSYFSNYEIGDIAFIHEFSIRGNTLFHKEATINEFDNTDQVLAAKTATEKALTAGKGIQGIYSSSVPGLKEKMSLEEDSIVIKEVDSHGNYIVLEYENNRITKRTITYWDDEPASAKPVQASSYSITSTAPGIKLSTSKELTLKDLISKPLGVIDNPSKSLWGIDPEKVIEYIQGNKEWKCTESYGTYSIREGFNRTFKGYPLDVDVKKYEYVNYSYGYGYYVTMGYKDQETKEAASREMEKLFNIVVKEFRDLGIELTQSQGESWVRAEKTIGDMHYLVALNKPVEIDGKVFNEDYYVSIGINKPL